VIEIFGWLDGWAAGYVASSNSSLGLFAFFRGGLKVYS